jgi:beta-mannosidase
MRLERWTLGDFGAGEGEAAGAATEGHDDGDWLPIEAPGDVHRPLIAAGRIPDPFYDRNETACAWMEEREWWYRLRFDAPDPPGPGERLRLVFHGLDTFATVWLNGEEIGRHRNMFRPAVFDVTVLVRPNQTNTLALRFDPPLTQIEGIPLSTWGRNVERTAMRKAQFGYGWDWGPRLPTIGIWRSVELRREREAVLAGVHGATVELTRSHDRAVVAVRVEAERFSGSGPLTAHIALAPPDGAPPLTHDLVLDGARELEATAYLTVDRPCLWWIRDLGEPALHDLRVTLLGNGVELDAWQGNNLGIRTLALDQAPDPGERGTRFFRFVLNGVPIFARGADWIPCDSFVGAIPLERYDALLTATRNANMTMIRVWGGGIYEHDVFYDACDRLGLLVWQDFMFACAMYPEDDAFAAEVEAEARYKVRRLRSHPCLALWCGNNENQWLHDRIHWDQPALPPYGERYYNPHPAPGRRRPRRTHPLLAR